ncbi:MAG: NAD(P)H-hydrate dehydratase [Ruminococcus sp.]|nr:NAD(P)H-hydrate dehydratase [Ruminococcus sp.]
MQIVTPKQMRRIEDNSERFGVSKKQLMINAGKELAYFIDSCARRDNNIHPEEKSIVFLAGSGNNGGDCYAAAEILVYRGYKVTVIDLCGKPSTELAAEMFSHLPERVNIITGYKKEDLAAASEAAELSYMTKGSEAPKDLSNAEKILTGEKHIMDRIREAVGSAYILVDGVFGTGFHGQLDKEIVSVFNMATHAYKIAVDVPSGGNCSSGSAAAGTFVADETITFGFLKSGMTQYPLKKFCGKITIADIGIPKAAVVIPENERRYFRIERGQLAGFPPVREKDSHKGNFGKVLVIAGSAPMRGAAAFTVLGALRSGAGLVRLASVEKCIDTVSVLAPEATFIQLDSDDYGFMLFDSSKNVLLEAMKRSDAVVIGCGMGVTPDTSALTKFVVQNAKVPVIIDADGINCIASDIDILLQKKTDVIITPHMGEMARLLNCESPMIAENRLLAAEKYAEQCGITVVLKGAGTVVSNSRFTASNHTGNPGMSCGGSGDILAGIIGAIVAQGYSLFDAACAGVYIHGLAGDSAAEKYGQEAMLPRDIINCLSDSFRILKEKHRIG